MRGRDIALLQGKDPLAVGCVGYWPFEEGAGTTVRDWSGSGNNGLWQGTLGSQWGTGKIGGGGVFNGTDNYISLSTRGIFYGDFAIAGWVNSSNFAAPHAIVGHSSDTSSLVEVLSSIGFQARTDTGSLHIFTSPVTMATGTYYHAAFLRLTGNLYLYVNALPSPTNPAVDSGVLQVNFIGRYTSGAYFPGALDEIGLWNRALSSTEIALLYNNGLGYRPRF